MSRATKICARALAAALTAAATASVVACGDDDAEAEQQAVATTVEDLQEAFAERDVNGLCARMTRRASRQAGSMVHGRPSNCPADVRRALRIVRAGSWERLRSRPHVVEIDGDEATATIAVDGRSVDAPLVRRDGRWKLDSFFGTARSRVEATPSHPSVGGYAVAFARGPGRSRCRDFRRSYPEIEGGCAIFLRSPGMEFSVVTPFGGFRFGRCHLVFELAVDGDGQTWIHNLSMEGDEGCGDVEACRNRRGLPLPWQGRIYRDSDGALEHHADVCLDTCVGFYEGELVTELVRDRAGWRMELDDSGVGLSGWRIDGQATAESGDMGLLTL